MYEIIYDIDYIVEEDMYGDCVYDTTTCKETFTGSHIELLDYIKQMRDGNAYNIEAYALYDDEDYDY